MSLRPVRKSCRAASAFGTPALERREPGYRSRMATRHGPDGPGLESCQRHEIYLGPKTSKPAVGPVKPPYLGGGTGFNLRGVSGWGLKLTTHLYLAPR